MKNKSLIYNLVFCLFISIGTVSAQNNINIKGRLTDSLSLKKINNALVSLYIQDSLITQTTVNNDGVFDITVIPTSRIALLKFSHINYFNKSITIRMDKKLIELGTVELMQKSIRLSEVNITAKATMVLKKNKDTLEADFSKQNFKQYVMTGKALEIIPGLKVIDSKIFYNGEEIGDVKVGERDFIFDSRFLMQNLPGFTISKIQIIEQADKSGKKTRRLNIVLRDNKKKAYLFDTNLSKGTEASNWNSFTGAKIDSLYQLGVRIQSNNINQLSDAWDLPAIIRGNQLPGLIQTRKLELSGFYQLSKFTSIDLKYLDSKQTSKIEQNSNMLDLISKDQSTLNSSSNSIVNTHMLNFIIRNRIDSITNLSFRVNSQLSDNNANNISSFISNRQEKADTVKFQSQRSFNGKEASVVFALDKLRKSSKRQFYDFEFRAGSNNGENKDHLTDMAGDSLENRKVNNNYLGLSYRLNFYLDKHSSIQAYVNSDLKFFTSENISPEKVNSNVKSLQNNLGFRYTTNRKQTMFSFDLSAFTYNLRSNINASYHVPGFVSNISYSYLLKNNHKISFNFNSDYNLPTIQQITGISPFGQQQLLGILPNSELKPEQRFAMDIKYNFRKLLAFDLSASYNLNKIENVFLTTSETAPVIQYINSGNRKNMSAGLTFDIALFKNKITIVNSIGGKYNEAGYLSENLLVSNNTVSLYNNFSLAYKTTQNLNVEYTVRLNQTEYVNHIYPDNLTVDNNLILKYNIKEFFELSADWNITRYYNYLNFNNNSNLFNIVISQKLLKRKNIVIFAKLNNIFNNKVNQFTLLNIDRIQYTNSNNIGRYFLFGINYKISTFK
jgi:hypothetical protein